MSLENNDVSAVVEHCCPVNDVAPGDLVAVHQNFKIIDLLPEHQVLIGTFQA